jgi:hypothetical protein
MPTLLVLLVSCLSAMMWPILLPALLAAGEPSDTQQLMLSGQGKDDLVPWEFKINGGRGANQWTSIGVPSSWECQGFGSFGYQTDAKPYLQGIYRRSFTVPETWRGRHLTLVFEAVQTDTTVLVNDQPAGPMHIGGFYRFSYDITALAKAGAPNRIEVTVDNHSSDESVNQAERIGDYWNFSGIIRPVYLVSTPPEHIERLAIDAKGDGRISVDAFAAGSGGGGVAGLTVEAEVLALDGARVATLTPAPAGAQGATRVSGLAAGVRPWSAESPALYQLEVRLMRGATLVHRVRQRFGFRTIELRVGDGIYVNGHRVVVKGCCRHTFWPDSGRTTSAAVSVLDVGLIKDMNMNAVRMSHYPPEQSFLDCCDEQGLYVLDELTGWQHHYASPIGHTLVAELVVRDVNHPSIIMWDNGNEGGWNKELDDDFAQWDPSNRQVVHPWANFRDLNTKHYPDYKTILALCAGKDVLMPTEFNHGLFDGGAGAGLWDYWEAMRTSPVIGGGFIWAYLDEGVKRVDQDGRIDVAGNRAPDGIVGPYREKEASFFTIKAIWSPIVIPLAELPAAFSGELPLENRYDTTPLTGCTFAWELRREHGWAEAAAGHTVLMSGSVQGPPIAPRAHGSLHLPLPAGLAGADVLALSARDAGGREILSWAWPLRSDLAGAPPSLPAGTPAASASDEAGAITLVAGKLRLRFDKATGYLTALTRKEQAIPLGNGPRALSGASTLKTIGVRAEGADQLLEATYEGSLRAVTWRLRGDGWLHLDYTYHAEGAQPLLGVGFDLSESAVVAKRWLGLGPYRVWKNRMLGGTLGVWENAYNDSMTGHSLWQYPEFKGFFAEVRWLELGLKQATITVLLPGRGRLVQVLTPKWPSDSISALTTFPDTTFALLDGIPPIGDKFHKVGTIGPQSAPNQATGDYHGSCDLHLADPRP